MRTPTDHAAALALVFLASCGSNGDSASPAGAVEATPAPSAAPTDAPPATNPGPGPRPGGPGPSSDAGAAAVDPFANTVTVYAIHAPRSQLNPTGLMWESPGGLTRQVLMNEAGASVLDFKHSIGHASVRVDCAAAGGNAASRFTGAMTNANDGDLRKLVLEDGVGLGVMFENVAGRVQTEAEVQADIDEGIKNGETAFVRFGVDATVCRRLVEYAAEYQKLDIQKNYGLAVRPLYKEGAGCSAFMMSFLELANLVEPRFLAGWSFRVRVPSFTAPLIGSPEPLIGGTLNPGVTVPVMRAASLTRGWATPLEAGHDIFGWDPTQMEEWIQKAATQALADGSEKVEVTGKLRGLVLDRTKVVATPALMNGTFWTP